MEALRFKPLLQKTAWGGDRIAALKHLPTHLPDIGESWEISDIDGKKALVSGGQFDGRPLGYVVSLLKGKLVGEGVYRLFGDKFPLTVKFVNTKDMSSVETNPNEQLVKDTELVHDLTEMWYVLKSDEDADLYVGLKKKTSPKQYSQMVDDGTILNALAHYHAKEDECFFIPAGRIHAVGHGCLICVIQQALDTACHVPAQSDRAEVGVNYQVLQDYRQFYVPERNRGISLVQCQYFHTSVYDIDQPLTIDIEALGSFLIATVVDGEGKMSDNESHAYNVRGGDVLLFPATTTEISVDGRLKLLTTYV